MFLVQAPAACPRCFQCWRAHPCKGPLHLHNCTQLPERFRTRDTRCPPSTSSWLCSCCTPGDRRSAVRALPCTEAAGLGGNQVSGPRDGSQGPGCSRTRGDRDVLQGRKDGGRGCSRSRG